jgi:hypothetical protein
MMRIPQIRPTENGEPAWAAFPLLSALLFALLLAAGCASGNGGRSGDGAGIDYRARHEAMLDTVLERPGRLERYRLELEEQQRARSLSAWEQVIRRNEQVLARRQEANRGDLEAYLRMLERIKGSQQQREMERTDRWARFLEANVNPSATRTPAGNPSGTTPRR